MKKRKNILWHINGIIRSDVQKGIKEKKELNGPNFSILPLSFFFFLTMAGWPNRSGRLERNWLDSSFFPAPCVCVCSWNKSFGREFSTNICLSWDETMMKHDTRRTSVLCMDTHTIGNLFTQPKSLSRLFFRVSLRSGKFDYRPGYAHTQKTLGASISSFNCCAKMSSKSQRDLFIFSPFSLSHKTHNNVT